MNMDVYGGLSVDEYLLDLPSEDFFSSSSSSSATAAAAASASDFLLHRPSSAANACFEESSNPTDIADVLCVPTDDAAELEWLSNYMDDSFTDFQASELSNGGVNCHAAGFPGRARSKRSRPSTSANQMPIGDRESFGAESGEISRRCTHCASEKTPQWRTGPLGPKTLCNACGVRYKSGRLVPEYRPAASPTFVLTQHSNSHRKVLELRRQKEMLRQQQQQEAYGRHFRVC